MGTLNRFINFFRLSKEENEILQDEIRNENIRRTLYLSLIAIPISTLHVIYFWINLKNSQGIEYTWRISIIYSHLLIVVSLSLISLLIYFFSVRSKKDSRIAALSVHALIIFLLIGGAAIASVDQLVTTAINPFIVTCMVSAVVFLFRPTYALIYYTAAYILFYFMIGVTQTNPDILISNRVNGITIAGVGLCLSFIFWSLNMVRIKQQKLIGKQQYELGENYKRLKYYSDELKENNTTKDKLFSVIAHDLRGPFMSLIGITQILTENFEIMSLPEIKKTLVILNKEAELSYELLDNLLIWSRTQLKKIEPRPEEVNLSQLTEKTFGLIENISNLKDISLTNTIADDIHVIADVSMLQSVLKNLLVNGIKFTHKGGKIVVGSEKKRNMIEVFIQDNGIGIAPALLNNLFDLTSDFTSLGTDNEKGTGLGLQICKEFIELNGGRIWVNSEEGKGSTFCFSLPAA